MTILLLSSSEIGLQFIFVLPLAAVWGMKGAAIGESIRVVLAIAVRNIVLYWTLKVHSVTRTFLEILTAGMVVTIPAMIAVFEWQMLGVRALSSLCAWILFGLALLVIARRDEVVGQEVLTSVTRVLRRVGRKLGFGGRANA